MYNYLTLGYDCSPAAALRNLDLRKFALPLDWVVSDINIIEKCLKDDFSLFHKNLKFNFNKSRLIDEYGFQFPHDYPRTNTNIKDLSNNIGDGIFAEENIIVDNWIEYYNIVYEKYKRRIERFRNIIKDPKPIIILCRYNIYDAIKLQILFIKIYGRDDVYIVNSCNKSFEKKNLICINTEINKIWNDTNIWKLGIDKIISSFNSIGP
jgi:hypothetical protein